MHGGERMLISTPEMIAALLALAVLAILGTITARRRQDGRGAALVGCPGVGSFPHLDLHSAAHANRAPRGRISRRRRAPFQGAYITTAECWYGNRG